MKRTIDGIIEDIILNEDKIPPIIVNCPNGENIIKDDTNCGLFYCKQKKKTMLAIECNNTIYRSYRPNVKKNLNTTVLAVYNKTSGKIRIISTEQWDMDFILTNDNKTSTIKNDPKKTLIDSFGSKKQQREANLRESMKINLDTFKEDFEQSINDLPLETINSTSNIDNYSQSLNLPSRNLDATEVKYVYNLYDILPKYLISSLHDYATNVLNNGFVTENIFFTEILQKITKPKRKKKIAVLIYLYVICNWLGVSSRDSIKISEIAKLYKIPIEVAKHVIHTFTIETNNGRQRPVILKDKAVIHCMIMLLILCEYSINIESLARNVCYRIGLKKLAEFAKILGLVADKSKKHVYTLKVPLPSNKSIYKKNIKFKYF